MNIRVIGNILGKVLLIEATLLLFPIIACACFGENTYLSFIIPIAVLVTLGVPLVFFLKPKERDIYAKEGFVLVAIAWLVMSMVGALPFVISKAIPNYIDALFEAISGFTTTGASVLHEVESLPKSILFWRSFTNWIGGMGVLAFLLAIIPKSNSGIMHAFRAEATGPSVSKLVAKMKQTARILYTIYIGFTLIEFLLLLIGNLSVFDSLCTAFANAGTGGFSVKNASIAGYNSLYVEIVVTIFMFIFSINFNVYFLILTGNIAKALKGEELRTFIIINLLAIIAVALNIYYTASLAIGSFGEAIRLSAFQVVTISSTTGFATANFDTWPTLSKVIFAFLMMMGGMAGGTAGGMKTSRLMILSKSAMADLKKMSHPHAVASVKMDKGVISDDTLSNTRAFFICWTFILILCALLISIEGFGDLTTNFSASLTCISNVGPGFGLVGPSMNFSAYSAFSKIILSIEMLFGRLEIFPLLVLFNVNTYKK